MYESRSAMLESICHPSCVVIILGCWDFSRNNFNYKYDRLDRRYTAPFAEAPSALYELGATQYTSPRSSDDGLRGRAVVVA